MDARISATLERFANGADLLTNAISRLAPRDTDRQPAPGKWTARQIAAHLADSEIEAGHRFRIIAAEPNKIITAFDQEKWADTLRYAATPADVSAAAFRSLRLYNAAMLRLVPQESWTNKAMHEERGPLDLITYLDLLNGHTENHVKQIEAISVALGAAKA